MQLTGGVVAAAMLVTGDPGRPPGPGWLEFREGRVTAVGDGAPPCPPELSGDIVVPGFVDLHQHGGAGASFSSGDVDEARRVIAFHRSHGTTTSLASLVSDTPSALMRAVDALSELVTDGELGGLHLEGPWLGANRAGAHEPSYLRDPEPAELERLLARETIAMVTIAPERDGASEAIRRMTGAGTLVAIGHTDADHDRVRAAIDAGARVGTHLFNAMAPLDHRSPGPAGALLADERVTVELICDGVHVHPVVVDLTFAMATGRVAAVTDSMSAAGMPDGEHRLGARPVDVSDGVARLRGTSILAGSTATSDAMFRRLVTSFSGSRRDALIRAVSAMSTVPAATLGIHDVGVLRPGARADLAVLDTALRLRSVLRGDRRH